MGGGGIRIRVMRIKSMKIYGKIVNNDNCKISKLILFKIFARQSSGRAAKKNITLYNIFTRRNRNKIIFYYYKYWARNV